MSEGTIIERLQSQRTLLVDVVRQIDTAIAAFGGTVSANGNGTKAKNGGRLPWQASASPAKIARAVARRNATRRENRARQNSAQPQTVDTF